MAKQISKEDFIKEMSKEETYYLKRILEVQDHDSWSDEQLEEIANILRSRGENIPVPKTTLIKHLLITSTHVLQDRTIISYLGVVTAHVVLGTGFFTEIGGAISDFFGTKAGGFQKKLLSAREEVIAEICEQTIEKGGNAILGLDIDFMTLESNMLMVSVTGTAAKVELN